MIIETDHNGDLILNEDALYEGKIIRVVRLNQETNRVYYLSDNGLQAVGVHRVSLIKQLQSYQQEWLNMMLEFDNSSERLTIETSIPMDMISTFILFIRMGYKPKKGKWLFFDCDKCRLDHGDEYIHASLVAHKDLEGVI